MISPKYLPEQKNRLLPKTWRHLLERWHHHFNLQIEKIRVKSTTSQIFAFYKLS